MVAPHYCYLMASSNAAIDVKCVVVFCVDRVMSVGELAVMVPSFPLVAMPLRRNALAIHRCSVELLQCSE